MTDILETVEQFMEDHRPPGEGSAVVLAVSGGVDSMVLLDCFDRLRERRAWTLVAAHANHELRAAESDADEALVVDECRRRGIPCVIERLDVTGHAARRRISIELAARELRYAFLERVRASHGASFVATAHHAEDNAETVLLNIVRGTGLRGLAGIPPVRRHGSVIRPMLSLRREAIDAYARDRRIPFRLDRSNLDETFARNELRLRIIPALEAAHASDVRRSLASAAGIMTGVLSEIDRLLDEHAADAIEDVHDGSFGLRLKPFRLLDALLQEHLLLRLFQRAGVEPTEARIREVRALAEKQVGRRVELGGGRIAWRDRSRISVLRELLPQAFVVPIANGCSYRFGEFSLSVGEPGGVPPSIPADACTAFIDADRLAGELRVRTWRRGDWFMPLGSRHRKKLSDLFTECHVPLQRKRHIPIIESGSSILWVCGLRLDDRFKLTARTQRALRITYQPMTGPSTP